MNKDEPRAIALAKLDEIRRNSDQETGHIEADGALCELLRALGYEDVVKAYVSIPKWYA